MTINYRVAAIADLTILLKLVQEFHETERLPFDETIDCEVLTNFLVDPALGRLWLIQLESDVIGYILITFGYSLEYRGRDVFIDEFYLRPLYRQQGIGTQTLTFVEDACQRLGVQALHLEADFANPDAQRLYHKTGYQPHARVLMTKLLTSPSRLRRNRMTIKLYDLAGVEDERRFSPPCWQVKMALKHKGLDAEEIPWRFTEKEAIAFSGQGKVPVLVDGDKTVTDSWEIVRYLEATYGDRPSLFGGTMGESGALFIKYWCLQTINPPLFRIILPNLFQHLHEKDKAYFRESREKMIGMTLEEIAAPNEATIAALQTALSPMREVLNRQPYLSGDLPYFADYVVFAQFQWARSVCPIQLLAQDDPVYHWRDRLLDAFDSYAREALGYPV